MLTSDSPVRGCRDFIGPAGAASVSQIAQRFQGQRPCLFLLSRDAGEFHVDYAVQFLQVPLDFGAHALWILIGIVFHFDFEKKIRAAHRCLRSLNLYTKEMVCAICQTRRPRRFCPGVRGDICTLCCGTEREVSVDCPLNCEYLREAHRHEKLQPLPAGAFPNQDLRLSREILAENEEFLMFLGHALGRAAISNSAIVDFDIREALEASIRTHRTLQSGLLYESLPANPLAAGICRALDAAIEEFRRDEAERLGVHKTRESTVVGLLVYLQHFEISFNNGRRRGRAFLDFVLERYSVEAKTETPNSSSLILP